MVSPDAGLLLLWGEGAQQLLPMSCSSSGLMPQPKTKDASEW